MWQDFKLVNLVATLLYGLATLGIVCAAVWWLIHRAIQPKIGNSNGNRKGKCWLVNFTTFILFGGGVAVDGCKALRPGCMLNGRASIRICVPDWATRFVRVC